MFKVFVSSWVFALCATVGSAHAQESATSFPKYLACREVPSPSGPQRSCLRGEAAIENFRREDENILKKVLSVQASTTESMALEIFGSTPRVVKPLVKARFDGTQYSSKSISWFADQTPGISEEERWKNAGTVEVQWVNGVVAQVWWHRDFNAYLNIELTGSPCVVGCPNLQKEK